jgi:hypothetical protein
VIALDDFFSKFIGGLDLSLPENGLDAPDIENVIDDVAEVDGHVLKITFDLFMFMNHTKSKYYMLSSNQRMSDMGEMPLKEAVKKFNRTKRKPS